MKILDSKIKSLVIVLMLAMTFMVALPAAKAETSTLYLSPASTVGAPPDIGQTFTVTLKVTGQTDLWSWKVGLTWNPAVLYLQSGAEGPFLKSDGAATIAPGFGGLNQAAGTLTEVSATRLVSTGLSGGGDLQTFTFKVVGYSATASPIAVVNAELHTAAAGNPLVPNTVVTGASFTLVPPPPHNPVAVISAPANNAVVYVGTAIALDGSGSQQGLNTNGVRPITSAVWGLTGAFIGTFNGLTGNSFTPTTAGDVVIVLTVTAPDGSPPVSGYNPVSTATVTIHVQARPSGPNLDIYTQMGGVGHNAWSDAFGPQQLVLLYGNVTYNNVAVANKDVAFEIQDNFGNTIGYVTARSNDQGIASASFRLPWPNGPNPSSEFGGWTIKGTVDISQVVVTDAVFFKFGYIITLTSIKTQNTAFVDTTTFHRPSTVVTVMTYSSLYTSHTANALISATLYDEANVPINAGYVWIPNIAANTVGASTSVTLTIPTWAYVGTAHTYGDAYSLLPHNLGVPYCPEISAPFVIAYP